MSNTIGRAGSAVPLAPSAPVKASSPAAPAAPAAPAKANGPLDTLGASKLMGNFRGKVMKLALEQAAAEHSVGTSFSAGLIGGSVRVAERVALKDTKVFKDLVQADRRRLEATKQNPNLVWAQTRALVGASASVGLPLGIGGSVGLSGNVEVSATVAHDVKGVGDIDDAVKKQLKTMVVPFDAEALQKLGATPGTEWMFRGTVGASAGVSVGTSATGGVGVDGLGFTASASAGVSAGHTEVFLKNVKVLGDNKVFVQVSKDDTNALTASANARLGLTVDVPGVNGGLVGKGVDLVEREAEKRLALSAGAWATVAAGDKVMGAAVLDLSNAAHREAYDTILRSTPQAAAQYILKNRLGPEYTETRTGTNTGINVSFGGESVLAVGTARGTTNGVIEDAGGVTLLKETNYDRNVGGFLPRLFNGEERTVSVRAGSVQRGADKQRGVAVTLNVKDRNLKANEAQQLSRFGQAVGAPIDGLPTPKSGELGEARYDVQLALTDKHIEKLRTWQDKDIITAFAAAQAEIDGSKKLPPWYSRPDVFENYKFQLNYPHNSDDGRPDPRVEYKDRFGRDLDDDVASERAAQLIAKRVVEARGKPPEQWGKVLEAVGKQASIDVRAAMLAMHKLSGAYVTQLDVTVGGTTHKASTKLPAPPSLAATVGTVMGPPA